MKQAFENATKILVAVGKYASFDDIVAGISLAKAIQTSKPTEAENTKNKQISLLLPKNEYTQSVINIFPTEDIKLIDKASADSFLVSIPKKNAKVKEVKWKEENGKIDIFVTTQSGSLEQKGLEIKPHTSNFDLSIVINISDLKELGEFYTKNQTSFVKTKTIQLKQISTDIGAYKFPEQADSTSTVVASFLEELELEISPEISTDLLSGIFWSTNSLSTKDPKTIQTISKFIENEADLKTASDNASQNLDLKTLKLTSKIIENLEIINKDTAISIVKSDRKLKEVDSEISHNFAVVNNPSTIKVAYIFIQLPEHTYCYIFTKDLDAKALAKKYKGRGDRKFFSFHTKDKLDDVRSILLDSETSKKNEFKTKENQSKAETTNQKSQPITDPLAPAQAEPEPLKLENGSNDSSNSQPHKPVPPPPINPLP